METQRASIQIQQDLADAIFAEAEAKGLSVDDYLRSLIAGSNGQPEAGQMSLAEIDKVLDELSAGTDNVPALPLTFSREDIYFDHD
ncbi:MAG: hypothetical protein AB7U82_32020 [Blastocatellales bacterium]